MASLTIRNSTVRGVYFHNLERIDLCQATYAHYVAFASEAYFYSPFVLIVANDEAYDDKGNKLKSVAKRSGVDQQLTYPNNHEIVGILWHMIHVADIMMAPAAHDFACEAAWCGRLELSPQDSWDEILAKSEAGASESLRFMHVD